MAVTSIWGCKGSVGTVTKYTANEAKTWNGAYGEAANYHKYESSVGDVMEYTADRMKTEKQLYVTGINCADAPKEAARMFENTKNVYANTGGLQCMHGYQSFKPGEVTPETAHKIGVELAKRLWGDNFEVLVSTHLNTGALHNHFVLNSVSFKDGSRYHCNQKSYWVMREESDRLCTEYGLSVIDEPIIKKANRYIALLHKEQEGQYTLQSAIKHDIDIAIAAMPEDFADFTILMEKLGYMLQRRGKDLRVIPNVGKHKPRRLRTLGDGYSEDDIKYRIRAQLFDNNAKHYTVYVPRRRTPSSLHGLYVHYCFLLGIYPEQRPRSTVACDYLKEDKMRVQRISDEAAMMGKYGIQNIEQLREHYSTVTIQLEQRMKERRSMRNSIRRMQSGEETELLKSKVKELSTEIKKLRREELLCQDIAYRSAGIEEVVRLIEEPDKQKELQRKEKDEK